MAGRKGKTDEKQAETVADEAGAVSSAAPEGAGEGQEGPAAGDHAQPEPGPAAAGGGDGTFAAGGAGEVMGHEKETGDAETKDQSQEQEVRAGGGTEEPAASNADDMGTAAGADGDGGIRDGAGGDDGAGTDAPALTDNSGYTCFAGSRQIALAMLFAGAAVHGALSEDADDLEPEGDDMCHMLHLVDFVRTYPDETSALAMMRHGERMMGRSMPDAFTSRQREAECKVAMAAARILLEIEREHRDAFEQAERQRALAWVAAGRKLSDDARAFTMTRESTGGAYARKD